MSELPAYQDIKNQQAQNCVLRYLEPESSDEPELRGVLIEVSGRVEHNGYERFSLLFQVADSRTPRQGMYAVTLPGALAQEWFLVPIGRNGDKIVYEACFNRLAATAKPGSPELRL